MSCKQGVSEAAAAHLPWRWSALRRFAKRFASIVGLCGLGMATLAMAAGPEAGAPAYDALGLGPQPEPPDRPVETLVTPLDDGATALGPQPEPPDQPATAEHRTRFTLIRVAPFSGVNPFDYRDLRRTFAGEGICTPGSLATTSIFPVIPPATAFIDIDATTNSLAVRGSGAAGADTALVVSLPAVDTTRFTTGAGWQAVTPSLPHDYPAGSPAVTFVLRHTDSGDHYRVIVGFLGTSTLAITSASGQCCGTGGCP